MPHYIPFEPGSRVKCSYRKDDTSGHEHEGTVLAKDDPRAWSGSIAFPVESPDPIEVSAHVARCEARGDLSDARQPVLWDFGKAYWDTQLYVDAPRKRMNVRVSYSTITEESVQDGDHADNGWIDPDYHNRHTLNDDDRSTTIELSQAGAYEWPSLRDAMRFMADKCSSIETDWYPGASGRWFSGTGCKDDCEGDELEVCYDLHISDISDGTAHRLARVMASNGVYFANVRELQRRRAG